MKLMKLMKLINVAQYDTYCGIIYTAEPSRDCVGAWCMRGGAGILVFPRAREAERGPREAEGGRAVLVRKKSRTKPTKRPTAPGKLGGGNSLGQGKAAEGGEARKKLFSAEATAYLQEPG